MRPSRWILSALLVTSSAAVAPIGLASGASANPVPTRGPWKVESNQTYAHLGHSVGTVGDVNGDGYDDVIVGAHHYSNGQSEEGQALVYHGSALGLRETADWTAESDQEGAWFGHSAGTAGDVNGDGYDDVIVGAYLYDGGQVTEGKTYVFHGSATGLSAIPDWTAESDQANARFGKSVGTAGDVNGDGFADVIVGASGYDNGQATEGRAYVYHGSPTGLSLTPDWTAESDQAGAQFGKSVSRAGDVNGDGYDDVIAGAVLYTNGQGEEGGAFVYHGSPAGLSVTPDWSAEPDQSRAQLGSSVSTAGDVNGDGYADVIVGADSYTNGEIDEGRAFVFLGSASGLRDSPTWTAEPDQKGGRFGKSVSRAGDVNGDGYGDVVVGADLYDGGQEDEGRAYVYLGSATGLSATADRIVESNQDLANLGHSVGTAGDVDADGYDDIVVGAPGYDRGEEDEGVAFGWRGRPS